MNAAATSRPQVSGRLLLGNSSTALALAIVVPVTVHELSRAVAGLVVGVSAL